MNCKYFYLTLLQSVTQFHYISQIVCCLSYFLTPWNTVLEKLTSSQIVKKVAIFYGSCKNISGPPWWRFLPQTVATITMAVGVCDLSVGVRYLYACAEIGEVKNNNTLYWLPPSPHIRIVDILFSMRKTSFTVIRVVDHHYWWIQLLSFINFLNL